MKAEDLKRLKRELVVSCETNDRGMLCVRCKVNGADCRLIVDTGSSRTIFDMPFAVRAFGREAVRRHDYKGEKFNSNLDSMQNDGSCLEAHVNSMLIENVEFGACRYNCSGRATALFLDFLARNHPGTLARANAALRAHAFDNETFWKDATGKTAAELEELWRRELGETPQLNVRSARARAKKW